MKKLYRFSYVLTISFILSLTYEIALSCSGSSSNEKEPDAKSKDASNIFGRTSLNCTYGHFECNGGGCYSKEQKCDGNVDCDDGSDEDNHHCGNILFMQQFKNLIN